MRFVKDADARRRAVALDALAAVCIAFWAGPAAAQQGRPTYQYVDERVPVNEYKAPPPGDLIYFEVETLKKRLAIVEEQTDKLKAEIEALKKAKR